MLPSFVRGADIIRPVRRKTLPQFVCFPFLGSPPSSSAITRHPEAAGASRPRSKHRIAFGGQRLSNSLQRLGGVA
jgi:hypothetical protein